MDEAAKSGNYGSFVVSAADLTDVSPELQFNYQGHHIVGLRRTDIDIADSISNNGVVIVGEGNFTFSFAMAGYFQSWTCIISTFANTIDDKDALIFSAYETAKDSCALNQELLLFQKHQVDHIFSEALQSLNVPLLSSASIRAPYQNLKRRISELVTEECILTANSRIESAYDMADTVCISEGIDHHNLENSKISGDLVSRNIWWQCPWKNPGDHKSTAAVLFEFLTQAGSCQQAGGLVCIGIINIYPFCTQYGFADLLSHPQYEFVGYDDRLIRELLLLGYSFQSRYVIDGAEYNHITFIFKRRE